jgi:integrase
MATIRKRGDKWQVQVRRAGHRPFSKTFNVRKDAISWARQSEVQADRAKLPTDPKALRRITLGELVRRYRDTVSVKKRAYENERISLNAFLSHPICSKRLSELRTEDFAAFRDERLKTIKPVSLKRQLDPIHNLFEVAKHEWGLPIRENPLNRLKLQAQTQKRERRLRPGELKMLMSAARSCRNNLIAPIIRLALATGMRRGEIIAIKKNHIDLQRRVLLIEETKNGHSRHIPLNREALSLLRERQALVSDRFFPISANAFRLAWGRVKSRAGIEDLHFHDLRHEAISRFFEIGLTTPEVASISGHRDARMLFRYAHAERQAVIRKLDQHSQSLDL